MSRSGAVEIDFEDEGSASNELSEYLIQQKKNQNNNSISGFFSNVGSGIQKIIPKKIGGTGSIEDDLNVRFGNLFGSSSSTTPVDGPSSSEKCACGFTLSRKERIIGFFILLGLGILFFVLSSFYIPVLIFAARKFSIFFTLGSVFTFASFSVLWGFSSFMRHLVSAERLPFTGMYIGSLFATLYFAIGLQSYVLTVIGIIFQVISLLSFIISYLPGGVTGMKYLVQMITSSVGRSLPI